jgi:hypothetical protein
VTTFQRRAEVRAHSPELVWILTALTGLYVILAVVNSQRFVWYDELLTYYISTAPTLHDLISLVNKAFDLQPLPGYLLSRMSMSFFGVNQYALRLPSIGEFYAASVFLFLYVRRKVPNGYAVFAVLMLWCSYTFKYATEARPYALILMSFSSLLLCWDFARISERRTWAIWGVAISALVMVSANGFGVFSLIPFLAAEVVRFARHRKPDYVLWAALLLPIIGVIEYVPMLHNATSVLFPAAFQPSIRKIASVFYHATYPRMTVALVMALVAALIVSRGSVAWADLKSIDLVEAVLLGILLLNPLLVNLVLVRSNTAFWDRYCITTSAVIYICIALFLGRVLRGNKLAGYAASLILILFLVMYSIVQPVRHQAPSTASVLEQVRPDLPLVIASALTFLEMHHNENGQLLSRIYYLSDRDAAIKYAHATIFEDEEPPAKLKSYFGLKGNTETYQSFTREHHQFLVLGTYNLPEHWLLPKLRADGAKVTRLGHYRFAYLDRDLYFITLPDRG